MNDTTSTPGSDARAEGHEGFDEQKTRPWLQVPTGGLSGRPPATDVNPADRPGVPMYGTAGQREPQPPLDQQPRRVTVLVGVETKGLTPVFGTAQPPHGLSGLIRRYAYTIPEHNAARWMTLMLGDRVDVMESRMRRHPVVTVLALALLGGGISLFRRRRAAARWW